MSTDRYDSFNEFYEQGTPPWTTDHPQSAVVALAEQGRFTGRVLDVGCGTGDNALHLASLGLEVLAVDGASIAIERAQAKAREAALPVEFTVADAFDLASLGRKFDTVLDSAFLHIPGNTPERRGTYVRGLADVLVPGGWAHFLEISDSEGGPSLTREEVVDAFDDAWTTPEVSETSYDSTVGGIAAWLVSVQRR